MKRYKSLIAAIAIAFSFTRIVFADPTRKAEQEAFFESKVKPVLEKHCFKCHGGGDKIRAELVLTNREDVLKGGESGPAVNLESPTDSLLIEAINYDSYEMPPSGKLPQQQIDDLTKWVAMGAPWKGEGYKPKHAESHKMAPAVNEESKQWWSFQKPVRPDVPDNTTAAHPIDAFIVAKLDEYNLTPNPRADKSALIRRAYYDLIGLPPTPEQVQNFLEDDSPDAYEKLIDGLLASKHYGEKWGRHWLDLVRYAESNSYERDGTKPFVWKYRDYVIRSFNEDKPYDQFIVEQLAGDEVDSSVADNIIATGYYRLGRWDDEPVDHKQAWFDDMDDVLKTTTESFLGLTVGCARCHDHKIDPVPQADYYRFLSFFRGVQRYGIRGGDTVTRQSTRLLGTDEETAANEKAVKEHRQSLRDTENRLRKIEELVKKDFIDVEHEEFKHQMNRVPLVKKRVGKKIEDKEFTQQQADEYATLTDKRAELRKNPPRELERALCVTEKGSEVPSTFVQIRGNAHAQGEQVEPGFPSVLSPPEPSITVPANRRSSGRRLALANWIVQPGNPLTARVMANRIWQHHFGRGIVRSSSDFGFQGTAPTHPKLLDWLAMELVEGGWKLKRLHKMIMLSDTYCMTSTARSDALSADPINNLFWRYNMRRLTAEEVRDSVLAVNGTLNKDKMFGPSIYPKLAKEVLHGQSRPGADWGNSSPEDLARRSVYIHIKRSLPVPLMASFDVADPDSPCPVRFNTVQPTQALAMINSKFINDEADKMASFVEELQAEDLDSQIESVLWRVTQREPTDQEVARGRDFVKSLKAGGSDDRKAMQLFCVVALNLNEFLYLD